MRRKAVAQRHAKATLQRLGDDGCFALRVKSRNDFKLVRLDQLLPVFFNHGARVPCLNGRLPWPLQLAQSEAKDLRQTLPFRAKRHPRRCAKRPANSNGPNRSRNGSDAALLARPAAIMRNRRHITDGSDLRSLPPAGRASALSRPEPGPFTSTSSVRMPWSAPCGRHLRPPSARRRASICAIP
jgi:hypothetical protein